MTIVPSKIRWGILGVAKINERLLPAFAKAANADLTAIASRSRDRAKKAADASGIRKAHESYEALLEDDEIDAVYIPLPNSLHAEWTRKAAEHGKHVLCEKPLAPTAGEAAELVAFCRDKGVQLMDGFMWPHHPRTARMKQLLEGGVIGKVQRVTSAFTFPLEPLASDNIRLQPALGGGSLLDVGCYPVYGIRWAFAAEPVRAYASARFLHGVDVEMNALLWFEDGRMATFDCGFTMPFRGWMEITGSEGVLRVPEMWLPPPRAEFEIHRDGEVRETIVCEEADQIAHMIGDFGSAIMEKKPLFPAPDEAVRTLRILDALARSAREGQTIPVETK